MFQSLKGILAGLNGGKEKFCYFIDGVSIPERDFSRFKQLVSETLGIFSFQGAVLRTTNKIALPHRIKQYHRQKNLFKPKLGQEFWDFREPQLQVDVPQSLARKRLHPKIFIPLQKRLQVLGLGTAIKNAL